MTFIDIAITALPLLIVLTAGLYARQYVKSVADFITANRCAGRYLLSIAGGELQAGAVVFVAGFEVFSQGGFAYAWWGIILTLVNLVVTIIGFVGFRYRETRAMTLAQFFEIRYNKSFRLFTGMLGFFAGLLNFGVIPAIGARVMVYFLGLPETTHCFSMTVPTYVLLMACFLSVTVFIALTGGLVTVMVVNAFEGIMAQLFYLVLIATILSVFTWTQMHDTLVNRPPGQSMVNPFDTSKVHDFNLWNVLMMAFLVTYGRLAWQNAAGYSGASLTPHEGRMGGILTNWRELGKSATINLLALGAVTYLSQPAFAAGAAQVHAAVAKISDPQAREQMLAPIALAQLLPVGVKGVLCATMLMGIFGGDATHLNSWGSIFVQDVLVPLRKKPFTLRAHLWALRCSIAGVACFAFLFGTFFHLVDYISMWWSITQAIFTCGAGSAIIGGLYWKKGTAAGAWTAFITGSVLCVGGIIVQQVYKAHGQTFYLNGTQINFFASLITVAVYVVISLLTCREDFNLERMLHRGSYATTAPDAAVQAQQPRCRAGLGRIIGIDENFTRGDKWITCSLFFYNLMFLGIFIVVSLWNLHAPWATESWARYYHVVGIGVPIVFAVVTGLWFTWGGFRDMASLFRRLKAERPSVSDDGTVVDHHNLDEPAKGAR